MEEQLADQRKSTRAVQVALIRMTIGIALGVTVGALLGVLFGNVMFGAAMGVPFGAAASLFRQGDVRMRWRKPF